MRKRIINGTEVVPPSEQAWLDLEDLARVEVTSEEAEHSIESALRLTGGTGWQAERPGQQMVRLLFDEPQKVRRIHLEFHEHEQARTQEFVLRWSQSGGRSYCEIVRQQYNFSPPDTTHEIEDYAVDLDGVTALELSIVPDISGACARASVAQLRLA